MINIKGKYTYEVEKTKHIINSNEFITVDGEIVQLHPQTLDNIAMDIVNYEEEKENKSNLIKESYKYKKLFESKIIELYGSFYFNFYSLLPDIPKQYLFRFIFLCTFLKYGDNKLYQCRDNRYHLLHLDDMEYFLKLSKKETDRTINILKNNNLIHINPDKNILINKSISIQGTVKESKKNKDYIRIFKDSIIYIYNNSLAREHKQLAALIVLLPYVNYNLNILCFNPRQTESEFIEPLTIGDIQNILYNKVDKNKNKLNKYLLSIKVNNEFCLMKMSKSNKEFFVVNPRIYYKGNNNSIEIDFLSKYFDV